MVRGLFAKWPKRRVRPVVRMVITSDMRKRPKCINQWLRQCGYTSGDRIVIMLESDFQHVADLANKNINSPMHAMLLAQIYAADMARITSANTELSSREATQPEKGRDE